MTFKIYKPNFRLLDDYLISLDTSSDGTGSTGPLGHI